MLSANREKINSGENINSDFGGVSNVSPGADIS